jgi:hypothetical protein
MNHSSDERDPLNDLPPGLVDAMRRAHATPPVPPEIDAAIRASAHARLTRPRTRRLWPAWVGISAAAAAILLVVLLRVPLGGDLVQTTPAAQPCGVGTELSDKPANNVTILDAFALARRLDAGRSVSLDWDSNADGVVDRRDVDALAHAAVRLERGT